MSETAAAILLSGSRIAEKGAYVSELQTVTVNSTGTDANAIAFPLVLIADPDGPSRARRANQLLSRGFRVVLARTSFEAIVKAACLLPDLILMAASLAQDPDSETADL